jgi:hypothetical protein
MKPHLAGPAGLACTVCLAFLQFGCCRDLRNTSLHNSKDRVVTISASSPPTVSNPSPCEVDFPVALLRPGKHNTITWFADDSDYWIVFVASSGFDNPIGIVGKKIKIPKQTSIGPYTVNLVPHPASPPTSSIYFNYAIYNADPDGPTKPVACKDAMEDHDTGLNVKP